MSQLTRIGLGWRRTVSTSCSATFSASGSASVVSMRITASMEGSSARIWSTFRNIAGRVSIRRKDGAELGTLERGESAFVPAGVRAYRVEADAPAAAVRVTLPPYVD